MMSVVVCVMMSVIATVHCPDVDHCCWKVYAVAAVHCRQVDHCFWEGVYRHEQRITMVVVETLACQEGVNPGRMKIGQGGPGGEGVKWKYIRMEGGVSVITRTA